MHNYHWIVQVCQLGSNRKYFLKSVSKSEGDLCKEYPRFLFNDLKVSARGASAETFGELSRLLHSAISVL